MPFFTEHMESLSNEILNCRNSREAAVTRLKDETAQVLADGRTLVKQLGDQTRAMTAQCRSKLAHDRRMRSRQVHALRDRIRREQHRAAEQLRRMLADNCAGRQEQVRELLHGFAQFQKALAADLHGAARNWRETQHRHPAGTASHSHHSGKEGRKEAAHKKGHGG